MKTINISGVIGIETTAKELRASLAAAKGDEIEVEISTRGGLVGEGIEMHNILRNYKGKKSAILTGYVMSMGSYIATAFEDVAAADNAIYMVHNVSGGVVGDHNKILKYGEETRQVSKLLAKEYAKKSKKDLSEIEVMMDRETYLYGQDIVDAGFANRLISSNESLDKESAVALASLDFQACSALLNEDKGAVYEDMNKLAAIFTASHGNIPTERKEMVMTLDTLRADHPEMVSAIEAEAKVGMVTAEEVAQLVAAAKEEGAQNERDRIADVRSKLVKGHEALIEALCADGKSTGADACAAIVAAEQVQRTAYIEAKGNDPVDVVVDEITVVTGSADERWEKDANLRAEFSGNKAAFLAYEKSIEAGHARILKK